MAQSEISKTKKLRETAERNVIEKSVQDLQKQARIVEEALANRIQETTLCMQMFENELQDVLRQIVDAESMYDGLLKLRRQLDFNTKVVETRLDNRHKRPRVENCRDNAEYG